METDNAHSAVSYVLREDSSTTFYRLATRPMGLESQYKNDNGKFSYQISIPIVSRTVSLFQVYTPGCGTSGMVPLSSFFSSSQKHVHLVSGFVDTSLILSLYMSVSCRANSDR